MEVDMIFVVTNYEKTSDGLTARGRLTVIDRDTKTSVTVDAYSGGIGHDLDDGVSLPIPIGKYEILSPTAVGFRLEAIDENHGNDLIEGTNPEQGNLRLHGPGATYGCLAVSTIDEWASVESMLDATNKGSSSVDRFGGIFSQKIEKFGNLMVVVSSSAQSKMNEMQTRSFYDGGALRTVVLPSLHQRMK
jgi:hypothetical protein